MADVLLRGDRYERSLEKEESRQLSVFSNQPGWPLNTDN
jgi:hypothetical protein